MKHAIAMCLGLALMSGSDLFAQSFTQTENTWIPDDGTSISFEMTVSGLPDVIDADFGLESVCLNIEHTWDSDLDIRLVSPDGSNFLLVSGVGWGVQNFTNTCLSESAAVSIVDGVAPYTGTFIPMGDMGVPNNGQDPNGIWKLIVYDTWAFADQGYMIDWSITFGTDPAEPFPFLSSTLPIVKIETGGQIIANEPKTSATIKIINHGAGAVNYVTDTDYDYEGDILVELQGFTGPYMPKKNYDFDLIDALGEPKNVSLLDMPAENDWILKAEYLDYSLMKNQIAYTMSRRMDRYAPRTVYCELMVDGEYMGIFSLTEKIKIDANRVDIATLLPEDISGEELTGGYIFEINENFTPNDWESDYEPINYASCGLPVAYKMVSPRIEEIMPEQFEYIKAYVDSFEDALYGPDFLDPELGYAQFISRRSFIDFMLVNEFTSNYDSYGRSTYLYKDKNGQLHIGPPWDYDRGYLPWTTADWVWEETHPAWPFPFWWSKFREDEEWRNMVYCRWTDLRQDVLSDAAFDALIDSLANTLGVDAPERNFLKWSELGVTDHAYFVEEVRTFLHQRLEWMDEAIALDVAPLPDATFIGTYLEDRTYLFEPNELNADAYFWYFGDGGYSALQSPVHTYADTLMVEVQLDITVDYGCKNSYSQMLDVQAPVAEQFLLNIHTYPNPAHQFLWINNMPAYREIQVSDMTGKVMQVPVMQNRLDVHTLPAGQYILQVFTDQKVFTITFIKS